MSEKRLAVLNTAPSARGGIAVAKWEPLRAALGIDARGVRVFDGERLLAAQIDRIDPRNPAHDELAILVDASVDSERILRVEPVDEQPAVPEANASAHEQGVKLRNSTLTLWINCTPDLDGWGNWFAGAVTTVELQGRQLLDFVASRYALAHEREKRCMQIDRLQIPRAPWDDTPFVEARLFDQRWTIVSVTNGPVRATATIASAPIVVDISPAPGVEPNRFSCLLYRTISLDADAESVLESMWLSLLDPAGASDASFWFSAHTFMFADFGLLPRLSRPASDRLLISADYGLPYGYAVAGNTAVDEVQNPPPDFPDHKREHRAFAWQFSFARRVEALHLFSIDPSEPIADAVGAIWYDRIHNPLCLEMR